MAEEIKVVGLSTPKNKGKANWKIISAIIGIIVLSIGVIAGILLVRQQQDIREQASGNCDNAQSVVQCPRSDGALVSCNPPDSNGNAQISLCNVAGRSEICGGENYCCPTAGGAWTKDMTACSCDAAAPTNKTTSNLASTSVTLKWTGGTGGKLRLWVSTDPNPTGTCSATSTTCVVNDKELPITSTEYELKDLKPNTKYYWRLMAWSREGCDSGGDVSNFTTTGDSQSATPSATATATATSTSTSTSKATVTATSTSSSKTSTPTTKSTSSASATAFPVPETGTDLPTVLGLSFGVVMILVSLGLAL
jgi:hypothetical protein